MKNKLVFTIFVWLLCIATYAQTIEIGGVVISSEDNQPIIGAAVVIPETSIGTVTDVNGRFSLKIPADTKQIKVSFIGMASRSMSPKANMTIILDPDMQKVEEVVVTGYQKVDRKMFTGSASVVKADEAKIEGVTDVSRMLQGKASGVQVTNVSGTFGAAPKIRVRGASSIYGNQTPLWVVDGVVLEDMVEISADALSSGNAATLISSAVAGLNADDIESFQILKDASATALYGARAMNGVVVITTKKGKKGTARINYTGEFTVRLKPNYGSYNIMNSQEQMSVYDDMEQKHWLDHARMFRAKDGGVYNKMYLLIDQYDASTGQFGLANTTLAKLQYLQQAEMRNTDWFDVLFKNTVQQNHSLSISSGSDKSNTYASLSYFTDPGWTASDKVDRFTANMNSTYEITKKLTIGLATNASLRLQRAPGTLNRTANVVEGEYSRDFDINPFSYALNSSRALSATDTYRRNYADFNILTEMNNNFIDLDMLDTKFQIDLGYKPVKGLEFNAIGAIRYAKSTREHRIKEQSNMALAYKSAADAIIRDNNNFLWRDPDNPNALPIVVMPKGGFYNTEDNALLNYYFRGSVSYNNIFKSVHAVNFLFGSEVKMTDRLARYNNGYGYQWNRGGVPFVDYRVIRQMLDGGGNYYGMGETYDRFAAFFGTATYSYNGTYTLNLTSRYDGSNRLGRAKSARWLPTWNVSGSWNVGNEGFMLDNPVISTLILRGTYGLVASMGPADNALVVLRNDVTYRPYQDDKEGYIYIESLENSELTWEKQHELNVGIDLGLFNNIVSISSDVYKRKGFDLIGVVRTSGIGGELQKYANFANMEAQGVEFSVNTRLLRNVNWSWTVNGTFAYNENEITNLKSRPRVIDMVASEGAPLEGYPVRSLFSIPFKGLDGNGFPLVVNEKGDVTNGGVYFQERTETNYLKYEGSIDPKTIGGLENSVKYKNFKLDLYFTYQFGNVIRLYPSFSSQYSDLDAMPKEMKNRWMKPGDEAFTSIPTIVSLRQLNENSDLRIGYNAYNYSTARVAKGDFVRLKDVTLTYEFGKNVVSKVGLTNLQLKAVVSNLWLIYADKKLNGVDPEFNQSGGVAMPMPRQLTFALRANF